MAATSGKLTALAIRNAGPGKHFDGLGLYVEVTPAGAKLWRWKYRFAGKEKRLSFGAWPEVSLAEARTRCEESRAQLRQGNDPADVKAGKAATARRKAEAGFPKVAAAWLAFKRAEWADETYRKAAFVIDTYLSPALRHRSIADLTTKQAADALADLARTAPTLAVKARQYLGGIVTYAIRQGLREEGRLLALRGALPKHAKGHIPAAVDVADVRAVLLAVDAYSVPVTRAALTLAMLTAQRPGVIAAMEWAEVDLDAAEWSIPAHKMKTGVAHLVPLAAQAVEVLRGMRAYTDGKQYVFPPLARQRTAHLHRDALSNALRRMGMQGKHATHGFRGMFRTVARERLRVDSDVLEAQLAHAKKGDVQKAYDRAQFVEERRTVAQQWADYLEALRKGAKVIPIKAAGGHRAR